MSLYEHLIERIFISIDYFIFGCQRSGTTLLCALLSEHTETFCLNNNFLFYAWARSKGLQSPSNFLKYQIYSAIKPFPDANKKVTKNEINNYLLELTKIYENPDPSSNKTS